MTGLQIKRSSALCWINYTKLNTFQRSSRPSACWVIQSHLSVRSITGDVCHQTYKSFPAVWDGYVLQQGLLWCMMGYRTVTVYSPEALSDLSHFRQSKKATHTHTQRQTHTHTQTHTQTQWRSKLFKSAGDGCGLLVNNKNDEYNDRRVQKV